MRLHDCGDIAWVEFDPVLGTEQAGRRPALVLTKLIYHEVSTRALVCPISSVLHDWPSVVRLPPGMKMKGVVLIDQLRSIDRSQRLFRTIERAPEQLVRDVRVKLAALLGIETGLVAHGI